MDERASGRRNQLLARLSAADFTLLAPHLKQSFFARGKLIQETDELIQQIYFPHSGMVSLLTLMRDGRSIETLAIGREGAVNITANLCSRRSSCRAVMQVGGDVAQIACEKFRLAAHASAAIHDLAVRYNDVQTALLQQTVGCNALHTVESRMCRWLLQTQDRCDADEILFTQEFLSEMLGVQRTTVTSTARGLQADNLIKYSRGRIEIIDRQGLEQRSCECYETARQRNEVALT